MVAVPKSPILRDPEWLLYLRDQPCVVTNLYGSSDPAHIRWGFAGAGLKPPDNHVLPLAHKLHQEQHQVGEVSFWRANMTEELLMRALLALAENKYQDWRKEKR